MSDERRRSRHREHPDRPAEGIDQERLRYFTQSVDGTAHTRHRRRRAHPPAADTSHAPPAPRTPEAPRRPAPPRRPVPPPADPDQLARARSRPAAADPWAPAPPAPPLPSERLGIVGRRADPAFIEPAEAETVGNVSTAVSTPEDRVASDPGPTITDGADVDAAAPPRRRRSGSPRRRLVLVVALVCMLVLVIGVGYVGLRATGLLESRKDYTNTAGTADVIVDIPDNSTLMDFGEILVDNDVVGSVRAFIGAADGQSLAGGYYMMRTQIPAETAVDMLTDGTSHRVGRVVVPPGVQLDTRIDADDRTTPGIFELIESAVGVTVNGNQEGVSAEELRAAAADSSAAELDVPEWARDRVTELTGDHRRIEGLIAPITWERVDPSHSAVQILRDLIGRSTEQFAQWGLPADNNSGLAPYDTLVAASLVQGEVNQPDDYARVARVILNRLERGQRLQFDSTANYTAEVTDLNVHSDDLRADTPWNTYVNRGLPPTPIGAVDEPALEAMENPADGDWLYFVTIDSDGTTLFSSDFDQHRRNIGRACANGFITCN